MPGLFFSEVSEFASHMYRDQGADHGRGTGSCFIDSHRYSAVLVQSAVIAANERIRLRAENEMENIS